MSHIAAFMTHLMHVINEEIVLDGKNCIMAAIGFKPVVKYFHSSVTCSLGKTNDMNSVMTQSILEFFKVLESP